MIAATLALLALSQPTPKYDPSVLQSIRDSSVRVQYKVKVGEHYFSNGEVHDKFRFASSSGTVVRADKDSFVVLTCSHGLYHGGKIVEKPYVVSLDGWFQYAKVLACDAGRDVAVLEVGWKDHPFKAVTVADGDTYGKGAAVIRCGHPDNRKRTLVDCSLTGERTSINRNAEHEAVELYPFAIKGDSGGGLFRASYGKLIGMTVSTTEDYTTSRAVTLKPILYTLKQAGVKLR